MEKYKLMKDDRKHIQRQSDLALFEPNECNKDYLKYLEDVENGAEVTDFDWVAENKRQEEALKIKTEIEETEVLVQNEMRLVAISALKAKGKLDAQGKLTLTGKQEAELLLNEEAPI